MVDGPLRTAEIDITRADDEDDPALTSAPATPQLPRRIGRYLVIGTIGAGGMGIVVAGYDTKLDRAVAIKLMHPHARGLNAGPRLVREAQALARVSHPNVVEIYDAGTIDTHTFIAMELVHGRTLKAWLTEGERTWTEVLAMFRGAAAGLVAAHAAGIVHRDFKPENVLVGRDGRPRVLDFGLALGRGEDSGGTAALTHLDTSSSMLATRLTATGLVVGTPAYMAPEQLRGEPADARSDQYSFCVALWEALFGERPCYDPQNTRRALAPVRTNLRAAVGAPTWLRRVVLRGLALAPAERWPSIDALVAALTPRARSHARTSVATLGILIAGVLAWRAASGDPSDECERASSVAAWDDATRDRVRQAMIDTGLGYAEITWTRVKPELDAFARQAAALRTTVCESGRDVVPVATQACLDHRDAAFAAVIEVLGQTDGDSLARATAVVAGLPDLAVCVDPDALADELPLPTTPADRDEATRIREGLLTVVALRDARRFAEGITLATELRADARALAYRPVLAESQLALGTLLEQTGDDQAAETALLEAAMIAKAEGLDRVATIAMTRLTGTVGYRLARVAEGRDWARHAESMVERARLDATERAQLLNNIGAVEFRAGDYERAEQIYRDAVALVAEPRDSGERQELANAHNNLGNVFARQGQFAEASIELEHAVDIFTELLGPEHPTVAMALINVGNVQYDLGHYENAARFHRRAYTVVRDSIGEEHPLVSASLGNLGLVMHRLGEDEEARRLLEESIALKTRLVGGDHPDVAFAMNNLGEVYRDLGRSEEALVQHEAAAAVWERFDPAHPYAAYPIANRGLDLLELGRTDEALVALREAMTMCERNQADPSIIAATRFGLAKAMVASGMDVAEAIVLATDAERAYAQLGGRYELERARIGAWLAHRQ